MSVRMALAKLSAFAASGALIGGGAVHVAEAPAAQVRYAKHAKQAKPARRPVVRAAPRKTHRIRRVVERTTTCAPQEAAPVPLPAPYIPPPPMMSSSGGGGPVVIGGGPIGGFGGGFFGGFFG